METIKIELSKVLTDPNQPRKTKSEEYLKNLAKSIKAEGLQSPITIRNHGENGEFMIVFGECRFRAHEIAELETIEAFVKEYESEDDVFIAQVVENTARENLPVMEQADSYRQAMLRGVNLETLAERVGKSVSTVSADSEMAGIEDAMVRKLINSGEISKSIGHELSKFDNSKIRTALQWALGLRNDKGEKKASAGRRTARQMKAGIDAYRQADGQLEFGYDYNQPREEVKEELVKAGKAYDRWRKGFQGFNKKYGESKLGEVVKAREASIEKMKIVIAEVRKLATAFEKQIAACEHTQGEKIAAVASA